MPDNITIQQILVSDTPNEGRIKINQNFELVSDSYNDHISTVDSNPHNTALANISYEPDQVNTVQYNNITNAKDGMDYSVNSIFSHTENKLNPHDTAASQLSDVTKNALTVNNTINSIEQVNNGLKGFQFLYNETTKLGNSENINVNLNGQSPEFASTNLNDIILEINSDFTKYNRQEEIIEPWNFTEGLSFSNNLSGDNLTLSNSFAVTHSTGNSQDGQVSFNDNVFAILSSESVINTDTLGINSNITNFSSFSDTQFNLTSTKFNFLGLQNGTVDTELNFKTNSRIRVGCEPEFDSGEGVFEHFCTGAKELTFEGGKISFIMNSPVEFAGPPIATYTPVTQLSADLDDFVTRRYVDQFIYEKDSFYSTNPILSDVTNIRDAINVLASQLILSLETDYSYSLGTMGADVVIDADDFEQFITFPLSIPAMSRLIVKSVSYFLPENIELIIKAKDESSTNIVINDDLSELDGTMHDGTDYYKVDGVNHVFIENNTENELVKLIEIYLNNVSLSNEARVKAKHSINFSVVTELFNIEATTTTTTTTTSTTTTTTA